LTEEILKGVEYGALTSLTLIPSEGGVFEVIVNGEVIHSKSETGKFPPPGSILSKLKARMSVE